MADLSEAAKALTALKPAGQWFVLHTIMCAFLAWLFHDTEPNEWPQAVWWLLSTWPLISIVAIGYVAMQGIILLGIRYWKGEDKPSKTAITKPRLQAKAPAPTDVD
jgi:hypothetical protein